MKNKKTSFENYYKTIFNKVRTTTGKDKYKEIVNLVYHDGLINRTNEIIEYLKEIDKEKNGKPLNLKYVNQCIKEKFIDS